MNNGKKGEALFKRIMQERNYRVVDVSNNPDFWSGDIDFIVVSSTTGAVKSFEVKWDNRINRTGNLYLEIFNINSQGGKGWYEFCQADYLAYGDAVKGCFYIIPLQELRERVKSLPNRIASLGAESYGVLVGLNDIRDLIQIL